MPYPFDSCAVGIFSLSTRMSSGGNGAPPDDTSVSDERSNESKSGCSSMRQNCVGTPDHADTRCSAVSCRCVPGSQRPGGGKTSVLPNRAPVMNSGAVPEMWKNGVAQIDAGGGASGDGTIPLSSMVDGPAERHRRAHVHEVAVGERGALGAAGRPRREQDHERVVLVDGDVGQVGSGVGARRHLLDEGREGDHRDVAVGDADLGEPVEPGLVAEEDLGRGELDAVRELGTGPPAVEPDDDAAEGDRRPLGQCIGRLLALANATRSPLPTPYSSASTAAYAAARAGNSENVTVSSGKNRYGRSPNCAAASRSTCTRLRGRWTNTSTGAPSTSSTVRSNGAPGPDSAARCSGVSCSSSCQRSVRPSVT